MKRILFLLAFGTFASADAQTWDLLGNAGTNPATDFVGTTDAQHLRFRTNNTWAGTIEVDGVSLAAPYASVSLGPLALPFSTGLGNTAIGGNCMLSQTSGWLNTAIGYKAMSWSTGGNYNVAVGNSSLYNNQTGSDNVAVGLSSLESNQTGSNNIGVGRLSLYSNVGGKENVAIGAFTLYQNLQNGIVALGHEALKNNTTGNENTAVGYQALRDNVDGSFNTATGRYALAANVSGGYNSAFGRFTLGNNITGTGNTAMGFHAASSNQSGIDNTGLGIDALAANIAANNCVAVGARALQKNQQSEIVAVGVDALRNNLSGRFNTAVGYKSQEANTEGEYNTALGYKSLTVSNGGYNTAIGSNSMLNNTNGDLNSAMGFGSLKNNTSGGGNVAVGSAALQGNTIGASNTSLGASAMYNNTTGNINVAVGKEALAGNTSGMRNTGLGYTSLKTNTTGECNTGVGCNSDVASNNLTNATAIGCEAIVDQSNKVRVGNTSVTSIGGQVGWTNFSDARYKKNVKQDVPGIEFINKLMPVTYTLDIDGINKHYDEVKGKNGAKDNKQVDDYKGCTNPGASKIVYTGFLAQEVEKAAQEIGYDFSGVDKPTNDDGVYGLRYSEFVPPLVKAVQEQQLQMEVLETQNAELQQVNDDLVKRIEKLEKLLNAPAGVDNAASNNNTQLLQNAPNPFSTETTISYTIADKGNVSLQLFDVKGNKVMDMETAFKDKGSYTYVLDGSPLQAGAYYYTLTLNGKRLAKKAIKL